MSVVDLADVKAHLNITVSTHDVELQNFIDGAESRIAREVGPLTATPVVERVRGGRGVLAVRKLPAISLTGIAPVGGVTLSTDDLHLDADGTIERVIGYGRFPAAFYDVSYAAGYVELPADLVLAIKELVRHLFQSQRGANRRPGSQPSDAIANTIPGAAYALPIRVEQLLGPYTAL